jgi:hypothetical protein
MSFGGVCISGIGEEVLLPIHSFLACSAGKAVSYWA